MEKIPEEEINLLDYVEIIVANLKFITIVTIIFLVFGGVYVLMQTPTYTSSATLVREMQNKGTSSRLSALQSFGINIGGGSAGITPETMPKIIKSRDVLLSVANSEYYFKDIDSTMSYIDYIKYDKGINIIGTIKKYTIGLPGTILSVFSKKDSIVISKEQESIKPLTKAELTAIEVLNGALNISENKGSGLMKSGGPLTISIKTNDPVLSTRICQEFIKTLKEQVRKIYTEKSRQNLAFIEEQFEEVKNELKRVEDNLAKFVDSNEDPQTAKLRTEIERLQRQVSLKTQLYQSLQQQHAQAQIGLQKEEPIVTIIEKPVAIDKSKENKSYLTLVIFAFLGIGLSTGYIFISQYYENLKEDEESLESINKIKGYWNDFVGGIKNRLFSD